jgi:hypothetical protein
LTLKPISGGHVDTLISIACLYSVEGSYSEAYHLLDFAYRAHIDRDLSRVHCLIELVAILPDRQQTSMETRARQLKRATNMLNEARRICDSFDGAQGCQNDETDEIRLRLSVQIEEGMARNLCERMVSCSYSPDPEVYNRTEDFFNRALASQKQALQLNRELYREDSVNFVQSRLQRAHINFRFGTLLRDHDNSANTVRPRELRHFKLQSAAQDQDEVLKTLEQNHLQHEPNAPSAVHDAQAAFGRSLYELGKVSEAGSLLKKSYDGRCQSLGGSDLKTLKTGQDLAMCMLLYDCGEAQNLW